MLVAWVIPLTKWINISQKFIKTMVQKGKRCTRHCLKNLEAFEPVAESYHAAIQEINDKGQLAELKNIRRKRRKIFHYYSLGSQMISAKQINNLISQDKFDAEAAMKKVSNWKRWWRRPKKRAEAASVSVY
ncbi:DUF3829 domain-containing protein [Escherichia coli]